MSKPIAVVTGANKGIGLEFVRQLVAKNFRVFACARGATDPTASTSTRFSALHALASTPDAEIELIDLDVANAASRKAAVAAILSRTSSVDLLINNAGILPHEDSLSVVTEENMLACFNVNCSGALLFTQEMIGAVVKSNLKQVVGISSGFASIGDNTSGGYYSYRISKAGMSMMTKCLALEFEKDGVQCIAIEPGWVATDMGTSRHVPTPEQPLPAGITPVDVSVSAMMQSIESKRAVDVRAAANGKLFWSDGSEMPY